MTRAAQLQAIVALCALLAAPALRAAGGHHAVDDAVMVEPGQCDVESWVERERGGGRTLLHAGMVCRVGPVELGAGWDRARIAQAATVATISPQLKWATELDAHWSTGLVLSGLWRTRGPDAYEGGTVLVPVSWAPRQDVALHLNAGWDFRRHSADGVRGGLAIEWIPTPRWSFLAERFREGGGNAWRVGGRWSIGTAWAFDLSRASGMADAAPVWWTLGARVTLDR